MPTGEDMMDFVVRLYERPAELHAEAGMELTMTRILARFFPE